MDPLDAVLNHRLVAPWIARVPPSFPLVQILRFGLVGVGVTAIHIAVALAMNGLFAMPPLWANLVAFLVACAASYVANWGWTFDAAADHKSAMPKFFTVSLSGFVLNEAVVYAVSVVAGKPMWMAMVPVAIIIPVYSFILNKLWVFLPGNGTSS